MGAPLLSPTQAEQDFAQIFASAERCADAQAGFTRFSAAGLPSRRVEAWHYSDLRGKLRAAPEPAGAPDAQAIAAARGKVASSDRLTLVTVDGFFVPELSDDVSGVAGLSVRALCLGDPDAQEFSSDASDALLDLNAALAQSCLRIEIAAGVRLEPVLEILALSGADGARSRFGRCILSLGEGASARLIETRAEGVEGFGDSAFFLILAKGAELDYACRSESSAPVEVQTFVARVEAEAKLRMVALVAGSPFLRRQSFVSCAGEGASVDLAGATLLRGSEHADSTLVLRHDARGGRSRETFKYVLGEQANGVFQGKIVVPPHAQKTDGKMLCRSLLLSDDASMSAKPELEIFADDVACGHGASVAKLDAAQLFYMESRGLPRDRAQALLIEAFAAEAFDSLADEGLRNLLQDDLTRLLASGAFA